MPPTGPKTPSVNEILNKERDTGGYGKRFLTWKEWKNQCEYQGRGGRNRMNKMETIKWTCGGRNWSQLVSDGNW